MFCFGVVVVVVVLFVCFLFVCLFVCLFCCLFVCLFVFLVGSLFVCGLIRWLVGWFLEVLLFVVVVLLLLLFFWGECCCLVFILFSDWLFFVCLFVLGVCSDCPQIRRYLLKLHLSYFTNCFSRFESIDTSLIIRLTMTGDVHYKSGECEKKLGRMNLKIRSNTQTNPGPSSRPFVR